MNTTRSTYMSNLLNMIKLDMIKKALAAAMQLCTKVTSAYFSIYEY